MINSSDLADAVRRVGLEVLLNMDLKCPGKGQFEECAFKSTYPGPTGTRSNIISISKHGLETRGSRCTHKFGLFFGSPFQGKDPAVGKAQTSLTKHLII